MNITEQGFAGYYDATLPLESSVGMGDLTSFFRGTEGQYAKVTTRDPAPGGDLRIRSGPGTSFPEVGAAEKGGVVTVLDVSDDGAWYLVNWTGGTRRAAADGWASSSFLTITDEPPQPGPRVPVSPGVTPVQPMPSPAAPGPYTPATSSTGPSRAMLAVGAVAALAAGWYFLR